MILKIKALSVNQAWQGKRYKTPKYLEYERLMMYLLPSQLKIESGELEIIVDFGFSSSLSDIDNCLKPLLDCLQKKYGFNDRQVAKLVVTKSKIKKGEEYINLIINKL
jgi:Holliday junction resolvase RusA-like endonuclease